MPSACTASAASGAPSRPACSRPRSVNPAGANGLFYGNPVLLWIQIKAVLITVVFSFVVGFVLLKLVDAFLGLRVSEHEERVGLDLTLHREAAYTVID